MSKRHWRAVWLGCSRPGLGLMLMASVQAQDLPHPPASEPSDSAPGAYIDRVIDPDRLGRADPDGNADDDRAPDRSGWPRVLRIDARTSTTRAAGERHSEGAIALSGRIDTPDRGAWTIDGALRNQPGRDVLFTLSQRGLPFDNGWLNNSSLGMINSTAIELTRTQNRFFLPGAGMLGVTTEWLQGTTLQWNASIGQPGSFESLQTPGFQRQDGHLFSSGLQWTPAPGWTSGVQLSEARDIPSGNFPPPLTSSAVPATMLADHYSARSGFGALAWNSPQLRAQANLLHSNSAGVAASGFWADGLMQAGRQQHRFGAFQLQPGLSWGHLAVNNDVAGAYYRTTRSNPRWSWDAGADHVRPVSAIGLQNTQLSGSARYLLDSSLGLGGGATLRQTGGSSGKPSWSAFSFLEKRSSLGSSRLQYDDALENTRHRQQISVDHGWTLALGSRLATSLGVGSETEDGRRGSNWSAAIYGGRELGDRVRLDGSLRLQASNGATRQSTVSASLGVVSQINRNWSVLSSYHEQRGRAEFTTGLSPLISPPVSVTNPPSRALFVNLRFEERAGSRVSPLGGRPGDGAGSIAGSVFFDANDNGQRDAEENVAANITILLDNKFPTRTDGEGRFEFALVSSGAHTLTVVADNLPLPWTVPQRGPRDIIVHVRETTTMHIAATRIK